MKTDVLIIGGGLSGLAAAYEAASRGLNVTLVDEAWALGGQLKQQTQVLESLPESYRGKRGFEFAGYLAARLQELPVKCLLKHEVIGLFKDGSVGVCNGGELIKIEAGCMIVATGAAETAVPFPGWTLPGVMTVGAAQILINRERVVPGKKAVVIGSSDMALEISRQMQDVGIDVIGVIESHQAITAKDETVMRDFQNTGIPLYLRSSVIAATGGDKVKALEIQRLVNGAGESLAVDVVCIDGGREPVLELLSILNCSFTFRKELGGWVPDYNRQFHSSAAGVFVAGQAAGITCHGGIFLTGAIAGISAVDYIEQRSSEERALVKSAYWEELEQIEQMRTPEVWQGRLDHVAKMEGGYHG